MKEYLLFYGINKLVNLMASQVSNSIVHGLNFFLFCFFFFLPASSVLVICWFLYVTTRLSSPTPTCPLL